MMRLTRRITTDERSFLTYVGKQNPYLMEMSIGEMRREQIEDVMSKLEDYEQAEEQGTLIRLPFKIGAIVYNIIGQRCDTRRRYVTKVLITKTNALYYFEKFYSGTIFLTKSDAESKINELEANYEL